MFIAILIVHVLVSLILVLVVLLQTGRGAELGAAFGGMGQATYGRTQGNFMTRFTTGVAVVFMSTSLSLAFMSSERPTQSVISIPEAPVAAPAAGATQGTQPAQPVQEGQPAPENPAMEQTEAPPQANPQPPEKQ